MASPGCNAKDAIHPKAEFRKPSSLHSEEFHAHYDCTIVFHSMSSSTPALIGTNTASAGRRVRAAAKGLIMLTTG
jgi:hypothetical protein